MSSENFPKTNRLLSKDDFAYLKSDSSCTRGKSLMAFHKEGRLNTGKTRIGISASRKVGNAVKRNAVKRQIREFFRKSKIKSLNKDILLVVHPRFYQDDAKSTAEKVNHSLTRIFEGIAPNE